MPKPASPVDVEADLGFATVDLDRLARTGVPEVIFGAGKTTAQILAIAQKIVAVNGRVLITRVRPSQARTLVRKLPQSVHHPLARCITVTRTAARQISGPIVVVCAGTSDLPVADEAAVTAEFLGQEVRRINDVGVAGLHRLLRRVDELRQATVIVVVAGMEGALPSVVAGLVSRPVIAVPTSVGYGANLGGIAALLGMLNSCGSGVTVVNIDNGFGAGFAAAQINTLAAGNHGANQPSPAPGKRHHPSPRPRKP